MAGFLKRLFGLGGEKGDGPGVMNLYVRCNRCKEKIKIRVSKSNDLTMTYEDEGPAYVLRKVIVGAKCPERMEANLQFDRNRNVVSKEITGGQFISREEFESEEGE